MTTIGIPPRTPDEWDVPPARLAADMAALVDRQRQQHADEIEHQVDELRAHARRHLAERGTTPSPQHWDQWHAFLDIDPDLRGRDYSRTGGAR
jgi:hypothetical protein